MAGTGKSVFFFGAGQAEWQASDRNLLGGKGANLAEMASLELPVPAGFTITTEVCNWFSAMNHTHPEDLDEQIKAGLASVEEVMGGRFGDPDKPLLLSVRSDVHGWELPGGQLDPGEAVEDALVREVWEETGYHVEIDRRVGDYVRSGFRPHRAIVYACRVRAGERRTSKETIEVEWFDCERLPATLFPWYHAPLADALADADSPVTRHEYQGLRAIWAGLRIDLAMRTSGNGAGRP